METLYEGFEQICIYKQAKSKRTNFTSSLKPAYTCRHYGKDYDRARPLLKKMRAKGWCKRDLFCLDGRPNTLGISNLWFYAHMNAPPHMHSHDGCSQQACKHDFNLTEDDYQVVHMRKDCPCKLVGPSPKILKEIIENGYFPVISLTQSGELKVERSDAVGEFVAISHCWSNGHGNPDDNTLPTCFLKYLDHCIDDALGSGQSPFDMRTWSQLPSMISRQLNIGNNPKRFWIDTLCIPRWPLDLRRKAIKRMKDPYAKAELVLVLDTGLTDVRSIDISPVEMFARVKLSNWAKRLWTFHEDAVGRNNYYRFSDHAVDILRQEVPARQAVKTMSTTLARFDRDRAVGNPARISDLGSAFRSAVQGFDEPIHSVIARNLRYGLNPNSTGSGLHWYRYLLETKSTSHHPDQALCLASLMGLDMDKVAEAKPEERMKVFWSLLDSLPIGILFSKSKKKLTFDHFRWAPASFLEVNADWMGPEGLHKRYVPRSVTDKGLRVNLRAIFLKSWDDAQEGINFDLQSFFQQIHGKGDKARFFDTEEAAWNVHFEEDWHEVYRLLVPTDGLAIVLEPYNIEPGTSYWGLLVSYKRAGHELQAQAHRHVKVKKASKSRPNLLNGFRNCTQEMLSRYDSSFLPQLLRASSRSEEPEKVDAAKAHLIEYLAKQERFAEEDVDYWRQYFKKPDEYEGGKPRETEQIDTVIMWCLLWPNVKAELSEKKLWFCID